MKWEEKAREISLTDRYELESLEGAWVTRRKYSLQTQEELIAIRKRFGVSAESKEPVDVKKGDLKKFHVVVLLGGIVEHNFEDKNGKKEEWTEEFISQLLEYPEVEEEIFTSITDYNAPLPQKSEETSD